jgi:hypothetical protein
LQSALEHGWIEKMTLPSPALSRFLDSMVMDHGRWRDGDPYDLDALDELTTEESSSVAAQISAKRRLDWRDVEALARIGTDDAVARIRRAADEQSDDGGAAALRCAADADWTAGSEARLIAQLKSARLMETSLDTLFEIAEAHPSPAVRAALLALATQGDESVRYAFGAFLVYLAGRADEWYGLNEEFRPRLLDLKSDIAETRAEAADWLRSMILADGEDQ